MSGKLTYVILVTCAVACGGDDGGPTSLGLLISRLGDAKVEGAKVTVDFSVKTLENQPLAGLTFPTNFQILEDGREISTSQSTPSVGANPGSFRALTLLLVDVSKSIMAADANLDGTRSAVKTFAGSVVGTSGGNRYLAVYAFDGRADPQKLFDFTNDLGAIDNTLDTQLSCANANLCIDPSTNLNGAIVKGVDLLKTARASVEGTGVLTAGALVAFTDGADSAGRVTENAAVSAVQSDSNKSSVFTIALASDAGSLPSLMRLGKDGFVNAADIGALSAAFQTTADKINGFANSYYRLQYCTPKRSGNHSIQIIVTKDLDMQSYLGSVMASFTAADSFMCQIQ